jgi:hypothetical protein
MHMIVYFDVDYYVWHDILRVKYALDTALNKDEIQGSNRIYSEYNKVRTQNCY